MSQLNNPLQGDLSPEAKAAVNARFYPSLACLGLIVAVLAAGTALNINTPPANALKHHQLQVDGVGAVVMERNNQHLGYSLFLAEAKPKALSEQGMLLGTEANWLPFHKDLKLTQAQVDAWDAKTPAELDVSTYEGLVVAMAQGSDVWLSTEDFAASVAKNRMQRWWLSAAGWMLAMGAGLLWLKARPAKPVR